MIFATDCDFSLDDIKELLEAGCDLYSKDNCGDTLLHYAVNMDNSELEKWLVEVKKFDTKIKNDDGLTAYDD